jgi:hypothetical protein
LIRAFSQRSRQLPFAVAGFRLWLDKQPNHEAMPPPAMEPGFGAGPGQFRLTHWSVVLAAGDTQSPQTAQALEK